MEHKSSVDMKEEVISPTDFRTLGSRESQTPLRERNGQAFDVVEEKQLVRTLDRRILPLLFSAYFLQFMDKIILNYANVMGLGPDINMSSNEFLWAGTAFFIGYLVAELPQGK